MLSLPSQRERVTRLIADDAPSRENSQLVVPLCYSPSYNDISLYMHINNTRALLIPTRVVIYSINLSISLSKFGPRSSHEPRNFRIYTDGMGTRLSGVSPR